MLFGVHFSLAEYDFGGQLTGFVGNHSQDLLLKDACQSLVHNMIKKIENCPLGNKYNVYCVILSNVKLFHSNKIHLNLVILLIFISSLQAI